MSTVHIKTCRCRFCSEYEKRNKAIAIKDTEKLIELVKYFSEGMWNTEEDLSYYKAIFDGSCPTAVEQLESALQKAKKNVS